MSLLQTLSFLSLPPLQIQTPLSYPRLILLMANLSLLSTSLANSLKGVNPPISRAYPVVVEFHLWLHSDRSFRQQRSSPPYHLLSLFLDPKLILMVRGLEFRRPQRSLWSNNHRLQEEPMPDFCGMKTAVFEYHPLKMKLSNYLHSTHLDDSFQLENFLTWSPLFLEKWAHFLRYTHPLFYRTK